MAPNDFNQQIIDEFRTKEGIVGGPFEGATLLLLHHDGRRSGQERITPLVYQSVDGGWAIFGSRGGDTSHPDWYLNVVSRPDVTIEVGPETVDVRAREAQGEERQTIWEKQKAAMPGFADYEKSAGSRVIPVVILERR